MRQPTEDHPDAGAACAHCEHLYERHEGLRTGRNFVFAHQEIARLLMRVGELASLRGASKQLREELARTNQRAATKQPFKRIGRGQTSKQANLAVNWIDAYAPTVIDALLPKSWPKVVAVDSTTMMTRGYRPLSERDAAPGDGEPEWAEGEKKVGDLKAGTIMFAVDHTGPEGRPFLIQAHGGKDTESWREFFRSRAGAPQWVIADLDAAIARAVRETWPDAILFHSSYHIRQLMRKNAKADGIPERIKLAQPVPVARPGTGGWSPSSRGMRKYGPHPLTEALDHSLRGPEEWNDLLEAIDEHLPADRLQLRSWITTNQMLIERQREILKVHGRIPLSTGSVEGKMATLLAPLKARAGRWQNVRRLNLVLGLTTIRARGDAREPRYAKLIRDHFVARHNVSHLPHENGLPADPMTGKPMSWWRTWHDRTEASLPRLVRESSKRIIRADNDARARRRRERLALIYAAQDKIIEERDAKRPAAGRPKRPNWITLPAVTKGMKVADVPELLDEWDWDVNGDLDPFALPISSKKKAAWKCVLNPDHTWEARVASRTFDKAYCPYHMRAKVHPNESVAALFPRLALEWHSSARGLRPDQTSHGSREVVTWQCSERGHIWTAHVYARTRGDGCAECFKLDAKQRTAAGKQRAKKKLDAEERAKISEVVEREVARSHYELELAEYGLTFPVPDDEDCQSAEEVLSNHASRAVQTQRPRDDG